MPEGPDVKWRFMWRIGDRPQQTRFAELNSPAIIPEGEPPACHASCHFRGVLHETQGPCPWGMSTGLAEVM